MSVTRIPKRLREQIRLIAKCRCEYCCTQEKFTGNLFEIDHIVPEAHGGTTEKDNLCLACSACNEFKGHKVAAIDQQTGELVALFNPRTQLWHDHFEWTNTGDKLIGKTPTGRATIIGLRLNRISLVEARQAWALVGWHPPL